MLCRHSQRLRDRVLARAAGPMNGSYYREPISCRLFYTRPSCRFFFSYENKLLNRIRSENFIWTNIHFNAVNMEGSRREHAFHKASHNSHHCNIFVWKSNLMIQSWALVSTSLNNVFLLPYIWLRYKDFHTNNTKSDIVNRIIFHAEFNWFNSFYVSYFLLGIHLVNESRKSANWKHFSFSFFWLIEITM